MNTASAVLLAVLVLVLVLMILSRKVRLPLAMEFGMAFIAIGSLAAVDSVVSDTACTATALMARWALIGGGLLLVLLSVLVRLMMPGRHRRVSDFIDLDDDELRHIRGGKGE